ncbi:MAG: hypothetical protein RBT02_08420 [Bacteroidales bacterium]|jgi:hypothetical protein|nr:hypothetical protein [Bacteroidales bacterium]
MDTEEINKSNEAGKDPERKTNTPNVKSKARLTSFIKKNLLSVVLALLLIVVAIWFLIKVSVDAKRFENEKTQLITLYETQMDSLQVKHIEFASTVFSWSVRSELMRNNVENLNQLLTVFVKESGADLVQLVNPENKLILLSSDKKFEGTTYNQNLDFEIENTVVLEQDGKVIIVTPVMGFNSTIGILIVELKHDN